MSKSSTHQKNGKGQVFHRPDHERIYETLLQFARGRGMVEAEPSGGVTPGSDCRCEHFGMIMVPRDCPLEEKIRILGHQIGHDALHKKGAHAVMMYKGGLNSWMRDRFVKEADLYGAGLVKAISTQGTMKRVDLDVMARNIEKGRDRLEKASEYLREYRPRWSEHVSASA